MLDRMMGSGACVVAALMLLQLGGTAEAQIAILVGPLDAPSCMARTVDCSVSAAECPAGEECAEVGGERSVCAPADAVFCCTTDADCPTDSTGTGGATSCTDVDGFARGICLPPANVYCAPTGAPLTAGAIVACHTTAGSTERRSYEDGDCDRDGIRNGEDPAPCLRPARIGVWVPSADGPRCTNGAAAELACQEVGDPCTLPDDRSAVCTANERTGRQPICSTLPDLFCCGGFLPVDCPAGECVLPSDVGDGHGMCTHPSLLCSERPTMEELLDCHTFGDTLTTIENGDCDGDGIPNADESGTDRCLANAPADGGLVTSDGGANVPEDGGSAESDAGPARDGGNAGGDAGAPFDAGGTPIVPSFNGGGGCSCRSAPAPSGSHGWLALVVLGLALALRRR